MIKNIYRKLVKNPLQLLIDECRDCKSLLDLGCSINSRVQYIPYKIYKVGVDLHESYLKESKKKDIHNKYIKLNILNAEKRFGKNSFDVVCLNDVIEHLTKKEGYRMMVIMSKIAKKKVIIGTPHGFMPQASKHNNDLQKHISGWYPNDFIKYGFKVSGTGGIKLIRDIKNHYHLKYSPKEFWIHIANMSNIFIKNRPQFASYLFCVKKCSKVD